MKKLLKIPGLSVLLILASYTAFGWLLSVHQQQWEWWIPSGALGVGISWFTAIVWAVVAIIVVFAKQKLFLLSIGICLIWAILMYVARVEIVAFWENRLLAGLNLILLSAIGLSLGWFADLNLIKSFGQNLLK